MEKKDWNLNNKKIIIIQGNNKVDGEINDGKVTFIEKYEDDVDDNRNLYPHYVYMNKFLKHNYKDNLGLQKYKNTTYVNILNFLLTKNGDIVCDEISYLKLKQMLICLPDIDIITKKQKEELNNLKEELKKENYRLCVLHDFIINNGIIESKNTFGNYEVLDKIISNYQERNNKGLEITD